jgi:hypothetical protein
MVAEYEPFQSEPEKSYGKVRQITHRVKEVDTYLTDEGKFRFPLGERKDALARLPPGLTLDSSVGTVGNEEALDDGEPAVVDGEGVEETAAPDGQIAEPSLFQPDKRGLGSWTDSGRWCGPHAGSTKPHNVDEAMWRLIYSAKDKRESINDYLDKLRSGTYVAPLGPSGSTPAAAPSGPSGSAPVAAIPKRRRGKQNPYKDVNTPVKGFEAIKALSLELVILEDGPSEEWGGAIIRQLGDGENVRSFNLLNTAGADVVSAITQPGTVVILHATGLRAPLSSCRNHVSTYLHEADKVFCGTFPKWGVHRYSSPLQMDR